MTAEPRWIDKRALLLLHEESLAEFGGARGLRDEGLLDSALARARNAWAYGGGSRTIAELAAKYGFGLARSHPFVDGNKRMAFLAIGLFLALNQCRLKVGKAAAAETMMAVAAGTIGERRLAAWIRKHIATT
jgi:death-on-curing protein